MTPLRIKLAVLVVALSCSIAACQGNTTASSGGDGSASGVAEVGQKTAKTVGASGGQVSTPGKTASISLPAGSLQSAVPVTVVVKDANSVPGSTPVLSNVYDFGPSGTNFNQAATLAIKVSAAPAAGQTPVLAYLDANSTWQVLLGSTYDANTGTVTGATTHFTLFTVITVAADGSGCAAQNDPQAFCAQQNLICDLTLNRCSTPAFTVGGVVGALQGSITLVNNGNDTVTLTTGGNFQFNATYSDQADYNIVITQQPAGQTCAFATDFAGTIATASVSVVINCFNNFSVGGQLSGLEPGGTVVLANGNDTLTLTDNGGFTFATPVPNSQFFTVQVVSQPNDQTCNIDHAHGLPQAANITNVTVRCSYNPVPLGGTIAGLVPGTVLTLANGNDVLAATSQQSGGFVVSQGQVGDAYDIAVLTQPDGQTCTVQNASGTVQPGDPNAAVIQCVANAYTVGGTIAGLLASNTVSLSLGVETITLDASAAGFNFTTPITYAAPYAVSISQQPTGQVCMFTGGAVNGNMVGENITNLQVTCQRASYALGGTVSGLPAGTTVALTLKGGGAAATLSASAAANSSTAGSNTTANSTTTGSTTATVALAPGAPTGVEVLQASNGTFSFATPVTYSQVFDVSFTNPPGQVCNIWGNTSDFSQAMPAGDFNGINVSCQPLSFTLAGRVTGLLENAFVTLQNGADSVTVANGSFAFTTPIVSGANYNITISSPAGHTCDFGAGSRGAGTMGGQAIGNVAVRCGAAPYALGGSVTGLVGNANVVIQSDEDLIFATNGVYELPTPYLYDSNYQVLVVSPAHQLCGFVNSPNSMLAQGVMPPNDLSTLDIYCAPPTFHLGGPVAGLVANTNVTLQNGADTISVANGAYVFPTALAVSAQYNVSIVSPASQSCTFGAGVTGSGIVGTADITGLAVVCAPQAYRLGGVVSGLQNSAHVTIRNGADTVSAANGNYALPTPVAFGVGYNATLTAPTGQTCQFVSAGAPPTGPMPNQNVTTLNVACGSIFYTLGGQVSGLAANTRISVGDGVDTISLANGTYTFPTQLVSGVGFNVTVAAPAGQTCTFTGSHAGTISSNVTNINIACAPVPYALGGNVTNLLANTTVTINNGSDSIHVGNGPYALPTALNANANYNVSVVSPVGQTCAFNGNNRVVGQVQNANVINLNLDCVVNQYFIAGSVTGLGRKNSVGIRNGLDAIVAVNGNFSLPTPIFLTSSYSVTLTTYGNQVCTFAGGNSGTSIQGSMTAAGLSALQVACTAPTYPLGGMVSGLVPGATVTLTNGGDSIVVGSGPYSFPTAVASGGNYQIGVSSNAAQSCTVTGGASGVMGTAGIVTANVACVSQAFALGGTVAGLVNNANLTLINGNDVITVQNGNFTFPTTVAYGAKYAALVRAPAGQTCQVTGQGAPPYGVMPANAVQNLTVVCSAASYTLGGNISGLSAIGSVKLQNGNDTLVVGNGPYTFATLLIAGVDYNVTLLSPPGQACAFTGDASPVGTVVASSINNINVSCAANAYSVGGKVANLLPNTTVQITQGTDQVVVGNGAYAFATPLPIGATYNAQLTSPPGQTCGFAGSGNSITGIVGNGNVYGLYVLCTPNTYPISVAVTGLLGTNNLILQNGSDKVQAQNGNVTFPTPVAYGAAYGVSFVSPANQVCAFSRSGPPSQGVAYAATALSIACSTPAFPIGGYLTGLAPGVTLGIANGNDSVAMPNGPYSMPTPVAWGASYNVTLTAPAGYLCTFAAATGGRGVVNGAPVTNINIGCAQQMQTLGGRVSGLLANTNTLVADANDLIAVTNGTYTMPTPLNYGVNYLLSTASPVGQTCAFDPNALGANGNTLFGVVGNTNATRLDILCTTNTYPIGGYVQGLVSNANLVVRNGNDVLSVGNGIFNLPTNVAYNAPYAVSVTSPNGQVCQFAGNANGVVAQGVMPAGTVQSLLIRCSPVTYTLGGTVSGAVAGSQVRITNGQDAVTLLGNGNITQTFVMPTALTAGTNYNIQVAPASAQNCVLTSGVAASGVVNANINNLNVRCTPNPFHLGGSVSGLLNNVTVTLRNGGDTLNVTNGNYLFPTPVAYGAPFNPTIGSPQFETCQFVNQGLPLNGNMPGQDYINLNVVCGGNTIPLSGSVSGLLGGTRVTLVNGNDRVVTSNGNFTFAAPVISGSPYAIVAGPVAGQQCIFADPNAAAGIAGNSAITNLSVVCAPQSYQLGGTLSRVLTGGNIVLHNGNDTIAINASGPFNFPTPVIYGGNYKVTRDVPVGETCRFAPSTGGDGNATFAGTMGAGNVNNVNLTCVPNTSSIVANVSGLASSTQLIIRNGNDTLSAQNGQNTLPTQVAYGSTYGVSLTTSGLQTCGFATGATVQQGPVSTGNVTLSITCVTPQYSIGGTVAGLAPNTSVTLKNGNDTVVASGNYMFPTRILAGGAYSATLVQPVGQTCNFATGGAAAGTVTANIPNLNVTCYPQVFPVTLLVSGLVGNNNVLVQNGNDIASIGNGNYIFPTPVAFGAQVSASLGSPSTQTCQFAAGSAQVSAVMNTQFAPLQVTCRNNAYTLGGSVSGLVANANITLQSGSQTVSVSNGSYTFPGPIVAGTAYDVSFAPVGGQVCSFADPNSSRGVVAGAVTNLNIRCATASFALSGNVYNLLPNTALALSDNIDQVSVGNGAFSFPTPIGANLPYTVSAYAPVGQTCNFAPGNTNSTSGVMANANVAGLTVKCNVNAYTLGGSVSGLTGNANLVARSGNDVIRLSNGTFTLPTAIAYNSPFSVTLGNGGLQTCTFAGTFNGSVAQGVMPAGPLQSLFVYCTTPSYSIGGTVTGLVSNTAVQLQNNGDTVTTFGGNYTFSMSIPAGGNYNVSVVPPAGQTCNLVTATSAVGSVNGNVTNINVACTPQQFTLGGSVAGLAANARLTLQNGNDVLSVGNGNYTFPTPVTFGAVYSASVTSPNQQTCQFSANGTLAQNRMPGSAVNSLNVVCGTNAYPVGGQVTGLAANTNVFLSNGGDSISVGNGAYTFPTAVIAGASYSVTIASPTGQQCAFVSTTAGQGQVQGAVSNVNVVCAPGRYSIAGTVNNLLANTNVTISNGNDRLSVSNGAFALPSSLSNNANYLVQVASPAGQTCVVTANTSANGSAGTSGGNSNTTGSNAGVLAGVVVNANVNLSVQCSVNYYSLGGIVQGLQTGSSIVLKTATDTLTQSGPGAFTFPTLLPYNAPYMASVRSTGNQVCNFSSTSGGNVVQGVMPASAVQSLMVVCYTPTYTVGGTVSGLSPNTTLTLFNNGGTDAVTTSGGNYTFQMPLAAGSSYNVSLGNSPAGQTCTLPATLSTGGPISANVTNVNVVCTQQFYPLGGQVSGLSTNAAVSLRNGNDRIVAGNGTFAFPTQLPYGTNYNVTLVSPPTQTCGFGNGAPSAGQMPAGPFNQLSVVCGALQGNFTISGVVSNLMANTNVTLTDGIDVITVGNGAYTFPSFVPGSSNYMVTVMSPVGQTCAFAGNGNAVSGVVNGNVTGLGVQCTPNFYSLGGYVNGALATGGNVTITNGSDSISVGPGRFTLPTLLAYNAPYSAQVSTTVPYLVCGFASAGSTAGGSASAGANSNTIQGVMPANAVQSLYVLCTFPAYSVGGTVTGLVPNAAVQVFNNGADGVTSFGGNYTFPTQVAAGGNYNVTVVAPPGETCSVGSAVASGNVTTGPVTNVNVACVAQRFTLGGAIAGLNANNFVTLQNGNDRLVVGNGNYTFPTPVPYGLAYNANVQSPIDQTCQFSAWPGGGVMPPNNVSQLNVQCGTQQGNFTVAGSVSGLGATTQVVVSLGNQNVTVIGSANYQLPSQVHGGDSYTISVTSPAGLNCAFAGGGSSVTGVVSSIVGNLPIQCTPAAYALGGVVSPGNFPQGANVIIRNGNDTLTTGSGQFTLPTPVAFNANYMVSVSSTTPYLTCGFAGTANAAGVNSNVIQGVMPAGGMQNLYIMCSIPTYSVGGTVTGLLPNNGVGLYNNADSIFSYGGNFTFSAYVQAGQNYNIVIAQPQGQICSLAANVAASRVVTGPIANLAVNCVTQSFTLGGSVGGLNSNNTLTLTNGNDRIVVSNGNYTFPAPVPYSAVYNATFTSPANQTCQFIGLPGNGMMPSNPVNQLNVGCSALQGNFQISGTVTNTVPNTPITLSDGFDTVSVTNGNFVFPTPLPAGTNFRIQIQSQPGQTCTIAGNANTYTGTVNGPVSGIAVQCAPTTYPLGGYASFQTSAGVQNGNMIIRNGNDVINLAYGTFTMPTQVAYNAPFNLSVSTTNPYAICNLTVSGSSAGNVTVNSNSIQGLMPAAPLQSISINCYAPLYQVGGTVSGLNANTPLQVTNNGTDTTSVTNGTFTFPNFVGAGGNYAVTLAQPIGQTCTVAQGAGMVTTNSISNIAIACAPQRYPLGGRIAGLAAKTNVVVRNGNDVVTMGNGNYTFATAVTWGASYSASLTAPSGQICQFSPMSPSGVMPASAIANLSIVCGTSTYAVGGQVSGLLANTNVTLRNGNDTISVANGNFAFPTGVVPGGTYSITVASPQNQGCAFVNPNMGMGAPTGNVSNLAIACVQGNFTIRGTVSNLVANTNVTIGDGVDTVLVGNGPFALPTALVAGTNYAVSILGAPGQTCSFASNGNVVSGVLTGNVTGLAVQCTTNTYAVGGIVSPGQFPQGATVTLRNGNDVITTGSGQFTLPTAVAFNAPYAISISSSTPYLVCNVAGNTNGVYQGVMPPNNLSLYIMCSIPNYSVGGTVSGLLPNTSVSVYNNADGIQAFGGAFTFPTQVTAGNSFNVSLGQVAGQTCRFAQGSPVSGVVTGNVNNISIVCAPQQFLIGGLVTGLNANSRVNLANGQDNIQVSNGNFTLPTPVAYGANFNVTLAAPSGQTCQFVGSPPAGVMPAQSITQMNVACAAVQGNFQISGNVSNLMSNTNVMLYDGFDTISIGNGPFAFPTLIGSGSNYFIQVQSPVGQTCTIAGANVASGPVNGPVSGIAVQCAPATYPLGGYASFQTSAGVQNGNMILRNGNDVVSLAYGTFTMPTPVAYNAPFNLSVSTTNPYAICNLTVSGASAGNVTVNSNSIQGLMPAAPLQSISISCYAPLYQVGGTVSGLNPNTPLQVTNNGSDSTSVSNGSFNFPNFVGAGGNYAVTLAQPLGQTCTVAQGTGMVTTSSISNVAITCAPQRYLLGGRIAGLAANTNVTVRNGNDVVTMGNGNYAFATAVTWGANYNATLTAPSGQICQFSPMPPAGVMPASAIANLSIVCGTNTYAVGGQVSGLLANTNVVLKNGSDKIAVINGNFTFPTGVVPGGTYNITLVSPQNQGCAFVNPNQSVGAPTANISNLAIACVQGNFTIRGSVSNLVANTNVTIGDGVDTVLVGNGAFALPTALVAGTNYAVSILGAPGQTCNFASNGNVVSGVLTGNVTGLAVQCTANSYAVGGVVSPGQFPQGATVTIRNGNDVITTGSGQFTLPTAVAFNAPYAVSISSSTPYLVCNVAGNTGGVYQGVMPPNNLSMYIMCSIPNYSVGGTVSGLSGNVGLGLYNNGSDGVTAYGGNFTFANQVPAGGNYNVTIGAAQGYACYFGQGASPAGVVTGPISNINVICNNSNSTAGNGNSSSSTGNTSSNPNGTSSGGNLLGGSVAGLLPSTSVMLANGNDMVAVMNGGYVFTNRLPAGANYNVTILNPPGQVCVPSQAALAGTMNGNDQLQINVACALSLNFTVGQAAIAVFGQNNFSTGALQALNANTFNNPAGRAFASWAGSNTYFPDGSNSRVLEYSDAYQGVAGMTSNIFGQPNGNSNVAVTHATASPNTFAPSDIAGDQNYMVLSDPNNNRVLIWGAGFPGAGAATDGATLVVGQTTLSGANGPASCSAASLSAPQSAALAKGMLVIADTNNNRVLLYTGLPTANGASATLALGQNTLTTCAANAGGNVSARGLSAPASVWTNGTSVAVVDSNNHRVLFWQHLPTASGVAADVVFGQTSTSGATAGSTAARLNHPSSVTSDGVSVYVADTNNNRVVVFSMPTAAGTLVDPTVVLGQTSLTGTACNQNGVSASSLCRPMGVSVVGTDLIVTDSGNNRFLVYPSN